MTTPIPPGSGNPDQRAGQDGQDGSNDLSRSASILSATVEKLGGWVQSVGKASVDGIKNYISGGATSLLNDLKSTLSSEIQAFGYLGQKAVQWAGVTSTAFFGAVGFLKKKIAKQMAIDKESKDYIKQMKLAAAERAGGDAALYNEEMARLKRKWDNEKEIEKTQKEIAKREALLLKAKTDAQKADALQSLNEQKKKKELLEAQIKQSDDEANAKEQERENGPEPTATLNPVPTVGANDDEDDSVGGSAVLEKLDIVDNSVQDSAYTIIEAIIEANEKSTTATREALQNLNDQADERSLAERAVGWMQAALISAPGWLTIAAVGLGIGALYGVLAYLVYTRWPEIVAGFNQLVADLGEVRDRIVEAIVDKIEEVVAFGNKLVDWARDLLPTFIEWWKMSVPEWMGGYSDAEKETIKAAQAQKELDEKTARDNAATAAAAAAERVKAAGEQTAKTAEELRKQTTEQNDKNQKSAAAPAPVIQTNVTGGAQTTVHGASNANKATSKSPARKAEGK